MVERSRRFKSGFLHKADLDQLSLRLTKLHFSHPRQVVLAMCTRFLKVRGLPLRGINRRRRSHVGRFGLRWDAVDLVKRQVHVCRTVALGLVEERTKTNKDRFVLLNERALHALGFARQYAERRANGIGKIKTTPYVFPPSKNSEYIKQTSDLHKQWRPALKALALPHRPPYNCRHTYATICLMSNMNPAFIAQQLGHSVQMLLTTYARWLNSSSDWGSWKSSRLVSNRYQAKKTSSNPLIGKVIDLHS